MIVISNELNYAQLNPINIVLTTFCSDNCVSAVVAQSQCPSANPICGNGILEDGEQCDNGNKPGCNSCVIVQGYDCFGSLGSSSICQKYPICGDAILDQG